MTVCPSWNPALPGRHGWCGRRFLAGIAALALAAPPVLADPGDTWVSNYDLVRVVGRDAVQDLLAEFVPAAANRPIRIEFESPHETTWLVSDVLGQELRARRHTVIHPDSTRDASRLRVKVVEMGLRYTGKSGGFLGIGGKRVERLAVATLSASLIDGSAGRLTWSGEGAARRIDKVPAGELRLLEGYDYPFTQPTLPEPSARRIVEPVVVSVIVGSLIFLFVSNRS